MIEDDNIDLEINYGALNEEFGDVDISDEEDIIQKEHEDNKKSKQQNRYEKQIRLGVYDKFSFPNYFTSQKARSKITKQEEQDGNKLFLGLQDKKEKLKSSKPKKSKRPGRKNYQTEYESYDSANEKMESFEENEIVKDGDVADKNETHMKHRTHKNDQINGLKDKYFQKLKFMLDCGFNLLIFGVGSRYALLNQFIVDQLQKYPVLVFNGYHQGCNIKHILKTIFDYIQSDIFKGQLSKHDLQEQYPQNVPMSEKVAQIKQLFMRVNSKMDRDEEDSQIFIIIHSMDIGPMKTDEAQDLLAELATIPQLSIICSMDHICSSRLWNDCQLDKFNFYMQQLDTFIGYDLEFDYQGELFSAKNENQEHGVAYILKSMTKNQREIIKLIAKYQIENTEEKGIKIKELLNLCVENMLCNNQKGLKDYLNEAKDHKVVLERIDDNGYTYMYISYPPVILEKIVNETLDEEQ